MLQQLAILIISLIVLGFSADYLVRSSIKIARLLRVSELFIGLTLVSMGTSAPEIAVSVMAALKGEGDLSIGNVVGSNIFNLGFILGLVAIMRVQYVKKEIVHRDSPVLLFATVLILFFLYDLTVFYWEGLILLLVFSLYLIYLWFKREILIDEEDNAEKATKKDIFIFIISLAILITASEFSVASAVWIAKHYRITEWAIGATVIAAGTSLPEVATSVVATIRKKFDISIGNVIGSDIFNSYCIIGISSIVAPITLESKVKVFGFADSIVSVFLLIITIIIVVIFLRTGWKLTRKEGLILLILAIIRMGFELLIVSENN